MQPVPLHVPDELLSAFADGELSPEESGRVQAHLGICQSCSAAVSAFRTLDDRLGSGASLTCELARPLLSAELDGELDASMAGLAREHLHACASCQAEREAAKAATTFLRSLPLIAPSRRTDAFVASLGRRRARALPSGALPARGLPALPRFAGRLAAAVVVAAAVVGGAVLVPRNPEVARTPADTGVVVAAAQLVVVNPRTNTLYALRPEDGVVVVRDIATEQLLKEIRVGGKPTALALDETRNAVFVLDGTNKTVTEISGESHSVVAAVQLQVSGTPTSLQVDADNKLVVATSSARGGGEITVIDQTSRSADVVRSVEVTPSQVVVDHVASLTYVVSADRTLVLDSPSYQRLETIPGRGIAAAPNGAGVTAILTRVGEDARVHFRGAARGEVDIEGTPLAVAPGPDGQFAVLVELGGARRLALVRADGVLLATLEVASTSRQVTYDARAGRFALIGSAGDVTASVAGGQTPAPVARATPSPSAAPQPSPSASPAPSASPSAPSVVSPRAPLAPAVLAASRPLWEGAYFFDLPGGRRPLAAIRRGEAIVFVDELGGLGSVDSRTGATQKLADLPSGPRPWLLALGRSILGPNSVYAFDRSSGTMHVIDPDTGRADAGPLPLGKTITAMSVAPDGQFWFASSSGALLRFDPAAREFETVEIGDRAVTAIAADSFGQVWYGHAPPGQSAVVGAYNTLSHRIVEYALGDVGRVNALLVDGSGTVWISTELGALLSMTEGRLRAALDVGRESVYREITVGPDGRVWHLTVRGRLGELSALGLDRTETVPPNVQSLAFDSRSVIWLASPNHAGFYLLTAWMSLP